MTNLLHITLKHTNTHTHTHTHTQIQNKKQSALVLATKERTALGFKLKASYLSVNLADINRLPATEVAAHREAL